ncbi:L-threonylcarbamoyladenylate synthase [Novipirellula artificiosorum]|uniref:Threonylcarbamoyl-AMP synthase n=1 Tax=Novipirellula artificiosorum TaxID=2528016 RepID=A0A5C6DEQ0_9BACT|nr:L-threonylcarbamoyladenylate synthase [Novipirellula artificiosorum]TWU34221.1 Threonylcarbamoyl-AMP synthase [Novipirellula artificiosorum]
MTETLIQLPSESTLDRAVTLLGEGRLVVLPTETVYGLAANAWNREAVMRIFAAKQRPANNPLIVHVASVDRIGEAAALPVDGSTRQQFDALSDLWPGPLTLVLPRSEKVPPCVTAGRDTVAVRVPSHPVATRLLERCPFPIAAPSANRSNYISPTTAEHCARGLAGEVELIIDGGPCDCGVESTIVALDRSGARLLRPGAVSAEEVARRLDVPIERLIRQTQFEPGEIESPGMLREHYSPSTPLFLLAGNQAVDVLPRTGRIAFSPLDTAEATQYDRLETLSDSGDLNEVARRLFAALRRLDLLGLDQIHVDVCEPIGMGRAIMDRLCRAAAKHQP